MSLKALLVATVSIASVTAPLSAAPVPCSLDPILSPPGNWQMTPDEFEKTYTKGKQKLYTWLTKDRTRAKLSRRLSPRLQVNMNAFEGSVPAQEVIVDFKKGHLNLVSVSIWNRADSPKISGEEFGKRFTDTGKAVGKILGAKPSRRDADPNSGLLTEGYSWFSSKNGTALLEHNEGAIEKNELEFLRLRMARPRAAGALAASLTHSRGGAAARLGDLPRNVVKKDNGDVYIDDLPMVDQGDKGYCVGATVQRAFEYYGIGADMHQIAEISDADPRYGTNPIVLAVELDKIDYRFKTRLEIIGISGYRSPLAEIEKKRGEYYYSGDNVDERKFLKEVRSYVDKGLPLLWGLQLGLFPEKPNLNPQTRGGHMRMIIGYNDTTEEILFSDSWGAGHELKRMKMSDAYRASQGLFCLKPTVH